MIYVRSSLRSGSRPQARARPTSVKSGNPFISPSTPFGVNHKKSTRAPITTASHAEKRNESRVIARSGTHGGRAMAPIKPSAASPALNLFESPYNIHKAEVCRAQRCADENVHESAPLSR